MARAIKKTTKTTKTAKTVATSEKAIEFKFFAPQAKSVCVGGNFNGWKAEKTPMKKDANGNWKTSVILRAGRHEYRYLVDGNWQNAQEPVECIPNAFGSWNCVIEVR